MRVGIFTDTYRPSLNGVVVSIESFATELERLGCRVVVFAPRNPRFRSAAHEMSTDVTPTVPGIHAVRWLPSLPFLLEPSARIALPVFRPLLRAARAERLDVVHTQTPFLIGYAGVRVARMLGLPLVHTYHTYFAEYAHYLKAGARLARRAASSYSRWICNLHDLILAPSRDIRELLEFYGVRQPIQVLMTGVPIPAPAASNEIRAGRARLRLPAGRKLLLFVGRLAREKNIELLIGAMIRLRHRGDDVELLLVGDGPDRERLEAEAAGSGLEDRVRFVGCVPHDDLRQWFLAADLFVFPSVTETQGLALLEAMAYGLPVVAAAGPGVRDLVHPGRSGLLVDPDPQRFAGAVHSLLDDPELSAKLATGARSAAEQLDARRQARRLLERYEARRELSTRRERRGLRGLAARAWEEAAAWR